MFGKTSGFTRMYRVAALPRPAAKFGAPVIGKGLVNFFLGVHDERAVLRYRFAYGAGLQHQQFAYLIAVGQYQVLLRVHFSHMTVGYFSPAHI